MSNSVTDNIDDQHRDDGSFDLDDTTPVPILAVPTRDRVAANDANAEGSSAIAAQLERLVELTESVSASLERIAEAIANRQGSAPRRKAKKKKAARKKA